MNTETHVNGAEIFCEDTTFKKKSFEEKDDQNGMPQIIEKDS